VSRQTIPEILTRFAALLGTTVENNRLTIPETLGSGYCSGYVLNDHIRILISDYELNDDLIVQRPKEHAAGRIIFFKFQHIFPKVGAGKPEVPSVLIANSRINTSEVFAIHSNTETINIEVDTSYLRNLLDDANNSPVLQSLLKDTQPLFFEQLIHPPLQRIVAEIVAEPITETFRLLFLRLKAEELICRLLMELDRRQNLVPAPINDRDIHAIYQVKLALLARLDAAPPISKLATLACMSPTKLKRLFKQVFGDSLFSYYQAFRMQEAARLLKEEKLTVSETGYQLGFTNLSHFARAFEEHIGMKPKRYSQS